jgi:lipopolysaccharide export system permease protein
MKSADRLVGKGLSAWVIFKLITFNLAWMVVLVVPMSVLVSTLMAFGGMTQENEVAIMKASGVSLYKMMIGPFIMSIIIAALLIQFNNHVYPNANHAARILLQDISKKKPTLSLVPGVFSQEVKRYSILSREILPNSNVLKDVTIYDNSTPGKLNVVSAEEGIIYFSFDQKKLIMDLKDGEIHESEINDNKVYRKLLFDKHKIVMDADQFSFEQSNFTGPRGDRELGAQDMIVIVDSLNQMAKDYNYELDLRVHQYITFDSLKTSSGSKTKTNNLEHIYLRAGEKINKAKNSLLSSLNKIQSNKKRTNRYWVEIHKKYSLPFACIVFILIGAPLGTMTRKGGFGVAAGISLIFFLIYWAFLIAGEKLADRSLLSPFWGMWSANVLLMILGIWLTIKSAKERVSLNFTFFQKFIPKKMRTSSNND